jgi:hypothetical protein
LPLRLSDRPFLGRRDSFSGNLLFGSFRDYDLRLSLLRGLGPAGGFLLYHNYLTAFSLIRSGGALCPVFPGLRLLRMLDEFYFRFLGI